MDPNPDNVVPINIASTLSIARSAAATPSIKRFVYTSSSGAAAIPKPGVEYEVNADTYNEEAVAIAYSGKGPGGFAGGYLAYSAAKTKAEQTLWKWYAEEKPGFVLNSSTSRRPNSSWAAVCETNACAQSFPTPPWAGSSARNTKVSRPRWDSSKCCGKAMYCRTSRPCSQLVSSAMKGPRTLMLMSHRMVLRRSRHRSHPRRCPPPPGRQGRTPDRVRGSLQHQRRPCCLPRDATWPKLPRRHTQSRLRPWQGSQREGDRTDEARARRRGLDQLEGLPGAFD